MNILGRRKMPELSEEDDDKLRFICELRGAGLSPKQVQEKLAEEYGMKFETAHSFYTRNRLKIPGEKVRRKISKEEKLRILEMLKEQTIDEVAKGTKYTYDQIVYVKTAEVRKQRRLAKNATRAFNW